MPRIQILTAALAEKRRVFSNRAELQLFFLTMQYPEEIHRDWLYSTKTAGQWYHRAVCAGTSLERELVETIEMGRVQ